MPRPERPRRSRSQRNFGTGEVGVARNHTGPIYGMTEDGQQVTVAFGHEGTRSAGHTWLADGHAGSMEEFWGEDGAEGHDHYYGNGKGTQRGKYTGYGS
ncbi:MAG TPA: hypothetical protein VJM32_04965 [Candidatus Saccharimonadales bacterium]|nr:hypothetical protein [Candidatus Saccharimonadales bacterium]